MSPIFIAPSEPEKLQAAVDLPAYGQINGAILGASIGADTIWHARMYNWH